MIKQQQLTLEKCKRLSKKKLHQIKQELENVERMKKMNCFDNESSTILMLWICNRVELGKEVDLL